MYAFFRSKVLNSLMILMIVCLFMMTYTGFMLMPSVCGSLALLLFASYAIWFWVRKPESIVINSWISDMNGWFTLYFSYYIGNERTRSVVVYFSRCLICDTLFHIIDPG